MEGYAGRGQVFKDPEKKAEMISFRAKGYAYADIARYYGVDHTTIMYHCRVARQSGTMVDSSGGREGPKLVATVKEARTRLTQPPLRPQRLKPPTLTQLKKAEEKRPGWMLDDHNEWICCGKSINERKQDEVSRRKKELEQRRISMLVY